MLRKVDENLVELATTQQVEVLNNLQANTNIRSVSSSRHDLGSRARSDSYVP